jgi:hypothetical protein
LATPYSREVRITSSGPQLVERKLHKVRRETRTRVDREANVELHEYRDVGIWQCVSYVAIKKGSITKRILLATGVVTGGAAIAFATGGLGIVGAGLAAKLALGTGAGSGLAFGAGGALPEDDRLNNYRKGERLTDFETQEPLTDWLLARAVPLSPTGPGGP